MLMRSSNHRAEGRRWSSNFSLCRPLTRFSSQLDSLGDIDHVPTLLLLPFVLLLLDVYHCIDSKEIGWKVITAPSSAFPPAPVPDPSHRRQNRNQPSDCSPDDHCSRCTRISTATAVRPCRMDESSMRNRRRVAQSIYPFPIV